MRNAWATSAHPTLLKNVWMFFQVAFGGRRQPESRVRALHTHPTARATLAYHDSYGCSSSGFMYK